MKNYVGNLSKPGPDSAAFGRMGEAYKDNNLAAHEAKALRREPHGIFWGSEFEGVAGWTSAPRVKTLGLIYVTTALI